MSKEYESAKRIALGIDRELPVTPGEDIWNISVGGDADFGSFTVDMVEIVYPTNTGTRTIKRKPERYAERSYKRGNAGSFHAEICK